MSTMHSEKGKGPASGPRDNLISRILFPPRRIAIIYLGSPSPMSSIGLPSGLGAQPFCLPDNHLCRSRDWAALNGRQRRFTWPFSSRGLPSCRCRHRHWWALTPPFHPYLAAHHLTRRWLTTGRFTFCCTCRLSLTADPTC
jgi:hypothetical protein